MKKLIGELLIESNEISIEELEKALQYQFNDKRMIGQILVDLEFITEETLQVYLDQQKKMD